MNSSGMIERAVINAGTLVALLVEAKRRGLVSELRPMLYQLKAAGYFLADSVIDAACQAAEAPH